LKSLALLTLSLGALVVGCRSESASTTGASGASASGASASAASVSATAGTPPTSSASAPATGGAAPVAGSAAPKAKGTRLVLLGTKGGPRVGPPGGARNPSTLILANGTPYVVDCGYGTSTGLVGAGVPLNSVRHVFITHHHSDHMLELGPLIYNAWVTGLRTPIDVYGPPGTSKMVASFLAYMELDIRTRMADEGRPDPKKLVVVHEVKQAGPVLENDELKVTAARVKHPPIEHAYSYRFDAKDRSIVISGDTAYDPTLAAFAKGADVLVHEIMHPGHLDAILKRVPNATKLLEHLLASHTNPEEVGKIANEAAVKTLVLNHFVPGDDPSTTDATWTEGVKKHFSGQVVVGKDLLEIAGAPAAP
jgi:ribonuclease BN (tRNA processing enzyme)